MAKSARRASTNTSGRAGKAAGKPSKTSALRLQKGRSSGGGGRRPSTKSASIRSKRGGRPLERATGGIVAPVPVEAAKGKLERARLPRQSAKTARTEAATAPSDTNGQYVYCVIKSDRV